jgi:DNA replication protein DnaC
MSLQLEAELDLAMIKQHCKQLRLPTVAAQFAGLAEQATKLHQPYTRYLNALLMAELEDREQHVIERRIKETHMPRIKTLDDFDFSQSPQISAVQIRVLADGGYLQRNEPILFIGEAGTGKTHLASGLAVAACRQKKRVRFITAAGLVNELVEASHHNQLGRALARWARFDLIVLDEVGYVPLAEIGAELLFQVISQRAEKAALIITTNLPFSEWTQVFTNTRLCKALLDRITDQAHIIQTGNDSFRFKRTLEKRQLKKTQ